MAPHEHVAVRRAKKTAQEKTQGPAAIPYPGLWSGGVGRRERSTQGKENIV
jgi:hypothetical protein